MKSHYRVVVIGGGVVGASVLYHLTKYGWSDVALVERSVLTAGSSWHAAGGFHALNANPNMAILQAYTIDLLKEVEAESGQSIGMHMTGGIHVASAPERWEWLQASYRRFQAIGIDDVRLVTPEEIKARCPIINVDGVLGGMWADREGYVDTTGTVWAYAGAAKKRGATVIEHNRVLELKQRRDSSWDVVTEAGTINAEHVVNAGGLWAKQVGRMVGLDLPLSPLEHHYLLTETIPEIAALKTELPMVVDLEGFTYMRQDQKGMLVGIYETQPQHWSIDGAPWDYGVELLQENIDRIAGELELVHRRYPVLRDGWRPQMGQRRLHLLARRQSARRPDRGKARLLARLRRHGGVSAGRRRRQVAGGIDDPRRGVDRRLWPRHRPLRPPRLQSRIHQADDRRVLRPPFRDDLSQRAIAGRPAAQDDAGLRRDDRRGLSLGQFLGTRGPSLFRAARLRRETDAQAVERLRHRRRGMPHGARGRRPARYRLLLALRSDRPGGRALARLDVVGPLAEARPRQARADAVGDRQAQGRSHRHQLGRRDILDRGLLLSSPMAYALVRGPCARGRRASATFPTT